MAPKSIHSSIVVLLAFLFSFFLMFHTFGYDSTQKNILTARTVWSDFGSHIPLIRSFSMGDNFDLLMKFQSPEYPLFPGEPIRYHFLFYMVVGLLEKLGVRLDWALNIPSILGFTLLLFGLWTLAIALFKDKKIAFLSIIFFLFNGSLAFIKFFKEHLLSLDTPLDIMRANTFPAFGPWDGGQISAFWNLNIYTNQRHLALAFGIILLFIYWIARKTESSVMINSKHQALKTKQAPSTKPQKTNAFVWNLVLWIWNLRIVFSWGVIIGMFPYFHQPSLLIFAVLLTWYFLAFPRLRKSIFITALTASLLIIPQIITLSSFGISNLEHSKLSLDSLRMVSNVEPFGIWKLVLGASSLWHPGYLLNGIPTIAAFLSYWFANVGLHALIIPLGFLLLPGQAKKILFPLFLLFAVGNLFKFSIEITANHKFFNFAALLGNMITAYVIVSLYQRFSITFRFHSLIRLFAYSFICLFIAYLTLSGVIDFFVIANDSKGTLADVGNNQTATWIAANTPRDAVFLNSSFLYHPASLAGRKIFMGWPYFGWSAGYDTYKRNDEMKTMYESRDPKVFCPLLKQHNISFITVADTKNDPNLPAIDTNYFRNTFQPVFEDPIARQWIYASDTLCL